MEIHVTFDKEKALSCSGAQRERQPLGTIDDDDLLAVAGALVFRKLQLEADKAILSGKRITNEDLRKLVRNLLKAVEQATDWTFQAEVGAYDTKHQSVEQVTFDLDDSACTPLDAHVWA